jgi:transcriptional regulator with XRE-family HTH domain
MSEDRIELRYEVFMKALGQRIKQFRKARKLSLHDMVVKHGYRDTQWRRFERGGAANMLSLLKITTTFNTSLSELLQGLDAFWIEEAPEVTKIASTKNAARRSRSNAK